MKLGTLKERELGPRGWNRGSWEEEKLRTCLGNSSLFDLSRDTLRDGPTANLVAVLQMPLDPLFKSRVAWHHVPPMPLGIDLFHGIFDLEPAGHSEISYNRDSEEGHS